MLVYELVENELYLSKMEKKIKWTTFCKRTEMSKVDNISQTEGTEKVKLLVVDVE